MADRGPTLADVRAKIEANSSLEAIRKRDLLSALARIESRIEGLLSSVPATAASVRELFAETNAVQMGVSAKSFRNIRSAVAAAVRQYGGIPKPITRRVPLSESWETLLAQVKTVHVRQALSRLAAFCSQMQIAPEEVTQQTLIGLHEAMDAEEIVKNPRRLAKSTATAWNRCRREMEDWPQTALEALFKATPYTFPLEAFPEELQQEIAAWRERVSNPDPFDMDAPARPLRPATTDARILGIRRFASALIHRGDLKAEDVTSISVLLEPERFKSACRFLIERVGGEPTASVHNLANAMRYLGQHWCRLDQDTLAVLKAICKRLDSTKSTVMSEEKRQRLAQFDDPRNARLFLSFPAKQMEKAKTINNPMRAAKCVERALMVALLINCCLRQQTLRLLELSDFRQARTGDGNRCVLLIPPEKVKNRRQLEFELTDETASILDIFLRDYRPLLPGSEGPYLIPGATGGVRSKSSVEEAISSALLKEIGLTVNPHLIRDIIAKTLVERDPSAYGAVTTLLGHASDITTRAHYLGSETKAAGRYLDGIISKVRSGEER
tara:strand:- start:1738 stop:3402 length:1665 start_codon:yes stop_codon:yes gene_type:complete